MNEAPRWFRWLSRALPRDFREQYWDEVLRLATHYTEGRSGIGRTRVWLYAAVDVIYVATLARTRELWDSVRPRATLDGLKRDLHYGARSLGRDKAWTAFAVVIVGLGIGASVTVFSVVKALFIEPLPFAEPSELVWVSNGEWGRGQALSSISVQANYLVDIQDQATQLVEAGGFHLFDRDGDHVFDAEGQPQRATRLRVTDGLFRVLGVDAALGRTFSREETQQDTPDVVMLTHGFWTRAFGATPDVVGSSVTVDGSTKTVVGVLPSHFSFEEIFAPGRRVDYVEPWALSASNFSRGNSLGIIARVAEGATIQSAQAELEALAATRRNEPSGRTETRAYHLNDFYPSVRALRDHVTAGFAPMATALVGGVILVMLIVCANLSNLLLARGALRDRELAVRAALGASRGRIVRQLLTESLMLAAAGALVGTMVAVYGTQLIAALDLRIPLLGLAEVDIEALGVALSVAVTVGVLFGTTPALRGASRHLHEVMQDGARGTSGSRRRARLRNTLVVAEIAVAAILVVTSTLTAKSFLALLSVDLGYAPEQVIAVRVDPPGRFETDQARDAHYDAILERVRAAPGITAAGTSDILPMGFNREWDTQLIDQPVVESMSPFVRVISEGYLEAMGATIVMGRDVDARDRTGEPGVALVNQTFAAIAWPGEDPIGRRVSTNGEREVVGVVRDTRQRSVEQEPGPEIFIPIRQLREHGRAHLMVRSGRPTEEVITVVQDRVRSVDGAVALDGVTAVGEVVDASLASRRFLVTLMGGFALFALVLSSLGTYSVVSYSVAQRRREIGVRMALGASTSEVTGRVVRDTGRLAATGLAIGLVAASYATRFVDALLYQTRPLDPTAYLATAAILGTVATLAGFMPARRAARTDPTLVLDGG